MHLLTFQIQRAYLKHILALFLVQMCHLSKMFNKILETHHFLYLRHILSSFFINYIHITLSKTVSG